MERRLDRSTVKSVAEMICDIGGPFERAGWQLGEFLERSGWNKPPAFDGSARVPWMVEQLEQRIDDHAVIDQVLRRLCDPREYPEEPAAAATMAQALNAILGLDGLKVTYERGRPTVVEITPTAVGLPFTPPVVLAVDLGELVQDPTILRVLRARLDEVAICRHHGAPVMAIIGLGSLLEGVLYALLAQHDPARMARLTAPSRQGAPPRRVPLATLIDEAHGRGWIQRDARAFAGELREYRNYVHPRAQWDVQDWPDADTVTICWEVTVAALNDLGAALKASA